MAAPQAETYGLGQIRNLLSLRCDPRALFNFFVASGHVTPFLQKAGVGLLGCSGSVFLPSPSYPRMVPNYGA